MHRRSFLHSSLGAAAALAAGTAMGSRTLAAFPLSDLPDDDVLAQRYPFVLPALGYANSAVEPAVDAVTMGIHHDRHHAAYVTNLNKALESQPGLQSRTLRELLLSPGALPEPVRNAVRNNGGGHANHAHFWKLLAPGGARTPTGALGAAITKDFQTPAAVLAALKGAGLSQFGSGWSWLCRDRAGKLSVRSTANQDTPLSDGLLPVIGIDVWEHAYYLKYQNRRADYLDAVLAAINWDAAGAAFAAV
jgi:superoxide dismutase, Fe-Mn family